MTTIDDIARRAAVDALDDARRTVDVERGLADVRSQAMRPTSTAATPTRSSTAVRWWAITASAAAIVAIAVAATVVLRDDDRRLVPVDSLPFDSLPPGTSTTIAPQGTVTPTTGQATDGVVGSVSYLDPPALFEPVPFAAVDLTHCATGADCTPLVPAVATSERSVVVVDYQGAQAIVIDRATGDVRAHALEVTPGSVTAGPGEVLYGIAFSPADRGEAMIALALDGPLAGSVLASAAVEDIDGTVPIGPFGHAQAGVIDRLQPADAPLLGYVTTTGAPAELEAVPMILTLDGDVVSDETGGARWPLEIERHPDAYVPPGGEPPPAPTQDGAALWSTSIGPAVDGAALLRVVAWLGADGSVAWRQLPDGWTVGATDLWGTVLLRRTGDRVELAWLTPPDAGTPVTATTLPATTQPPTTTTNSTTTTVATATSGFELELLGIAVGCTGGPCTSVALTDEGVVVAYDPAAAELTMYADPPVVLDVSGLDGFDPEQSYLELIGLDEVAYLATQSAGITDPVGDLVAIALTGPRAGEVLARADQVVDLSGDSDLVPTAEGIVSVGCCSFDPVRPAADAPRLVDWVDSSGAPIANVGPNLRVEFADGSVTVVRADARNERTWTIPGVANYRGMPTVGATADGGAIVSLQDTFDATSPSRVVELHPDGTTTEHSVAPYVPFAFAPDGSMLVIDDGEYAWLRFS